MKVIIESLDELKELSLLLVFGLKGHFEMESDDVTSTRLALQETGQVITGTRTETGRWQDDKPGEQNGEQTAKGEATNAGEKTKRQRRTKEQIAADNAAAAQTIKDGAVGVAASGGKVVDVQANTVSGTATVSTELPAAVDKIDIPAAAIADETPVETADVLNDVAHLKLCRQFIADHGMSKYEQTFAAAGLTTNIINFSDDDRAKHAEAMRFAAAA